MKKPPAPIVILVALVGIAAFSFERSTVHTCAETGSVRGANYVCFIPVEEWDQSTWIEDRAQRLGVMPDKPTWVKTADTRTFFWMRSFSHSHAPVSFHITSIGDDHRGYEYTEAVLDDFTREFITASAERRKAMEDEFFDGAYGQ